MFICFKINVYFFKHQTIFINWENAYISMDWNSVWVSENSMKTQIDLIERPW